jgi:hypothetical protein
MQQYVAAIEAIYECAVAPEKSKARLALWHSERRMLAVLLMNRNMTALFAGSKYYSVVCSLRSFVK